MHAICVDTSGSIIYHPYSLEMYSSAAAYPFSARLHERIWLDAMTCFHGEKARLISTQPILPNNLDANPEL
jgi:hypothetical protein